MTMQAAQEFYKASQANQELIAKLLKDTTGPEDFLRNTVAEGNHQGYEFTRDEAVQLFEDLRVAATKAQAGGELSDLELEMVSGGKTGAATLELTAILFTSDGRQQIGDAFSAAGSGLSSAFSGTYDRLKQRFTGDGGSSGGSTTTNVPNPAAGMTGSGSRSRRG